MAWNAPDTPHAFAPAVTAKLLRTSDQVAAPTRDPDVINRQLSADNEATVKMKTLHAAAHSEKALQWQQKRVAYLHVAILLSVAKVFRINELTAKSVCGD